LDTWVISKRKLERGEWLQAFTLANANEGFAAHFRAGIPESSVTHFAGVEVAKWDDLLNKFKNNKYLSTRRTLGDYAAESKKAILELKGAGAAKLPLNTGKAFRLRGKTVYTARVPIHGQDFIIFAYLNQLKVNNWFDNWLSKSWTRFSNFCIFQPA
jgi:hypothetical protein